MDFRDEVGLSGPRSRTFLVVLSRFSSDPENPTSRYSNHKSSTSFLEVEFLPASFRTDFVVHYYVELVHRFPNIDAYVGTIQVHGKPALLIGLFTYFYESNILLFLRFISINHYSLRFIANSLVKQYQYLFYQHVFV